jgi:hypothetical protein
MPYEEVALYGFSSRPWRPSLAHFAVEDFESIRSSAQNLNTIPVEIRKLFCVAPKKRVCT